MLFRSVCFPVTILGYMNSIFISFAFFEISLASVSRGSVNKSRSVRQFRKNSARTKRVNVNTAPMRGGIRL